MDIKENSPFWDKIKKSIKLYHLNFLLDVVGYNYLSEKEINFLKDNFGKEKIEKKKENIPILNKIFAFGQISQKIGLENSNKITEKDLDSWLKDNNVKENEQLNKVKAQAYLDVLSKQFKIEKDIRQEILNQSNKKEFKISNIFEYIKGKFKDWSYFKESISYVSESALNEGKAEEIRKQSSDKDPIVYKVPIMDEKLCPVCRRLYLDGNKPKLFKLSELENNGTNIGKKPNEWLPVVGETHIHCRCLLQYFEEIPNTTVDDYEFDEEKYRYILKEENLNKDDKKIVRKSKVKITIGDKNFEV